MKGSFMVAADAETMTGHTCLSQETADHDPLASPLPSMVRGACPSLSAPMQTGDGLLVRLRPSTPGLTVAQFRALAEAAQRHGNGLIEITARGNLQLRGMTPDSMAGLAADIDRADIVPESGVAIEVPPLSGLDPSEIADARLLAECLRSAIDSIDPKPLLAAKLAIIVDGGGQLVLDELSADIRLKAGKAGGGRQLWRLAIAGTRATATPLADLTGDQAIPGVMTLLKTLAAIGPRARGRDLDAASLQAQFPLSPDLARREAIQPAPPVGVIPLDGERSVLGLRPAFGQISAQHLIRFLDIAEAAGAREIRTGPEHSLLLLGLPLVRIESIQAAAAACGFQTRADDPANYAIPCAGAGACASAYYATREAAADLVEVGADLLDGSLKVHLSGCAKGCAHPSPTMLTIVGAATGYAIVVNGSSSSEPVAYIHKEDLKSTLAALGELVRNNKAAGESAQQCLKRLGRDAIATALRQG
ncbi:MULTISPECIES: precorrin-3B synthase [unclassified Rhizobium]|uniref:precorrin-3B synthase n=1 Tax=unclassified Rhizobium TaxID=2613769 RepID=UPI00146AF3E4|nr:MULTISPECIES: precorrin-3B synthase [unclassified Rhizobium]MBB3285188.1 precorrin-3B synthase [Rhizobium sp. BK252]MBB3399927.1 precorrin-3B synthase [Rhizobium sp. BK289]MBB3412507.1 precorrin-3B synthase [Rhizobium sp. BK284]MBB3480393.1 precorrin-3B synthase [Rhizobium sp. BK347]MDK4719066.1 precorrin-3B synthase [Rhizobium sp. CNPSo 3968]